MIADDKREKLKSFFKDKGLDQMKLSQILGVSQPLISALLSGNKAFGRKTAATWEKEFGLNSTWLLTGDGEMLKTTTGKNTDVVLIPLLPIAAYCGSLSDFIVAVNNSDCEQIVSPIKGADFAMTVAGDSMAPEYMHGAQILIKKINERAFIDWGRVYVLDTCNGSVIKRILPSEDPTKLKCVSINPEYPPFEVSLDDVAGVYRVLLCMSLK